MIEFILTMLIKSDSLSKISSKEKSSIISEAYVKAKLMDKPQFKKLTYFFILAFVAATLGISFYYDIRSGGSFFVVFQWPLWYFLAKKAQPHVVAALPEEYRV